MPLISKRYVWAEVVATSNEAQGVLDPPRNVTGEACTAAATTLEATAIAGGLAAQGESCTAAATTLPALIASPALIDLDVAGESCTAAATCEEAAARLADLAVVGEACTAEAACEEATVDSDVHWAVICQDMVDLALAIVEARASVGGPPDEMRFDVNRDVRSRSRDRARKGIGYEIHAGAALGRVGDVVRPLQDGDAFAGIAAQRSRAEDPYVWVYPEGLGSFLVPGGTTAAYGAVVYATASNTFALSGTTAIGRLQGVDPKARGRVRVFFQALSRRSV